MDALLLLAQQLCISFYSCLLQNETTINKPLTMDGNAHSSTQKNIYVMKEDSSKILKKKVPAECSTYRATAITETIRKMMATTKADK